MRVLRSRTGGCGALLLCAALAGCHHQAKVQPLAPQAKTPDIFVTPPTMDKLPPMTDSTPPAVVTDAKPVVAAEVKPKRKPKKQPVITVVNAPPPVPAPAPVADPQSTEAATLGALAPGAGASPKEQQEVSGKIFAVEKRVNDLPAAVADKEQKQIAKVRLFIKEASDALKGGDVEGAKILATKADLLVDDIQKSE